MRSGVEYGAVYVFDAGKVTVTDSRAALAIWTRNYHDVPVGVTKPHFSVGWRRVDMGLFYDLHGQCASLFDDFIKIVHLEPEYDAVSERCCVRVDKVRVIVLVPSMELKNQVTSTEHPIIYVAMDVLWK